MSVWMLATAMAGGAQVPLGDDGTLSLRLIGQVRVEGQQDADGGDLDLKLHRIRPIVKARLADDAVRVALQLNTTPGSLEVLDVWMDGRLAEGWRLRAGQFKTPFTTYRARSFASMVLTDWALPTKAFGSERQLGVQLTGQALSLDWAFGAFSGANQRKSHGTRLPVYYGQSVGNPSALVDPAARTSRVSPELFLHVGRYGEGLDPAAGRSTGADAFATGVAVSAAFDTRAVQGDDLAARFALEGMVQGRGLGLSVVGYSSIANGADGLLPGLHGGLLEASVRVVEPVEVAARVSGTTTSAALRDDAQKWVVAQRLAAPDPSTVGDAQSWTSEAEVAVGTTVFLPAGFQVQADVAGRRRVDEDGATDALLARAQVQFGF